MRTRRKSPRKGLFRAGGGLQLRECSGRRARLYDLEGPWNEPAITSHGRVCFVAGQSRGKYWRGNVLASWRSPDEYSKAGEPSSPSQFASKLVFNPSIAASFSFKIRRLGDIHSARSECSQVKLDIR